MKTRLIGGTVAEELARGFYIINCPGCNTTHHIATIEPFSNGAKWKFDGNTDKPTFSPSLLVKSGKYAGGDWFDKITDPERRAHIEKWSYICHSFIKAGKIEFLSDCTHHLAGQTVDLPEMEPYKETPGE